MTFPLGWLLAVSDLMLFKQSLWLTDPRLLLQPSPLRGWQLDCPDTQALDSAVIYVHILFLSLFSPSFLSSFLPSLPLCLLNLMFTSKSTLHSKYAWKQIASLSPHSSHPGPSPRSWKPPGCSHCFHYCALLVFLSTAVGLTVHKSSWSMESVYKIAQKHPA